MAIRNESVRLSLQDDFTSGMARAAAATAILRKELNSLDGKSVSRDLDGTSKSVDKMGSSSQKAGPDIDKFSGRLGLLVDAAVTLGPALIPLSAAAIPALTGALAGLGAAAGGLGVAILAFQGLGDGLKAIDAYRLEPTVQNLAKMREEMTKLGPAGAEFAHYIANLEPTFREVQNVAREGLFPGVEEGIDDLLARAPQVERIIGNIAEAMGNLAADSGEALSSDKFTPFFDYIESDAGPTLEAFGRSAGNVALGVANMLVAFAPLSRDFTGGLEDATKAFAGWSAGLDDNQSFQDFVSYVREAGPAAVDFLVAITKAASGLIQAAAPLGQVVLPALTALANVFADIAASPIGPGLYTAAAALIAFNRASTIAAKSGAALSTSLAGLNKARLGQGIAGGLGLLAASASDADDKIGLANTAMDSMAGLLVGGPFGLAIGAAVGQFQDFKAASDDVTASLEAANAAMQDNNTAAITAQLAALQAQYDKLFNGDAKITDFGSQFDAVKGSFLEFTGQAQDMRARIDELKGSLQEGGGVADLFGETVGRTGDQLRGAASAADDFAGALARLNGWFDKRDAVRAYKDSIDAFSKGIKDGFTRDDAGNIDAVGRSILQVANNIKNPGARADFLQGAREQLVDLANNSGPRAAAAIQEVINKFDDKGLTHPKVGELSVDDARAQAKIKKVKGDLTILGKSTVKPTVDGNDNPWRATYGTVKGALRELDSARATPTVTANVSAAQAAISNVRSLLMGLNGTTATTYVRSIRVAERNAEGGYIRGPGGPKDDAIPSWLSNGEYVMPAASVKKYGVGTFDKMRALRFADGGSVGDDTSSDTTEHKKRDGVTPARHAQLEAAAKAAAAALKSLEKQSRRLEHAQDRQQKAFDKMQSAQAAAQSRYDGIASGVSSSLTSDIFASQAGSGNVWAAGATSGGINPIGTLQSDIANAQQFQSLYQQLAARGLSKSALEATEGGGLSALKTVAGYSDAQLSQFGSLYDQRSSIVGAVSGGVAKDLAGPQLQMANRLLEGARDDLKAVKQQVRQVELAVKQADRNNDKAQKAASVKVADSNTKPAKNARRRARR